MDVGGNQHLIPGQEKSQEVKFSEALSMETRLRLTLFLHTLSSMFFLCVEVYVRSYTTPILSSLLLRCGKLSDLSRGVFLTLAVIFNFFVSHSGVENA